MVKKKVVIVYNYIAHYRIPIFNLLSKQTDIEFNIWAGVNSEIDIKKADPNLSNIENTEGGLNWYIIKNFWIFKLFLLQLDVLKPSFYKKFDTVIYLGNMYYITTWFSAIMARMMGKKVVFWTHGFIRQENNFQGFIRSIFYKIPNEILVYGQRAKDILISKGFDESRINLIYNSLDFDYQLRIRNNHKNKILKKSVKKRIPTVGFIGRLTKQKKIEILLKTLHELDDNNKFNLLIIGDGEEKEHIESLTNKLMLTNYVSFYGASYDEKENCRLIKSMDVLVSPGEVGLTAIHAMTYGTPVITHNNYSKQMPEFEVIVPGLTGDFFDFKDPINSLKEIIKKWYIKTDLVEENCIKIISEKYNPHNQLKIFKDIC